VISGVVVGKVRFLDLWAVVVSSSSSSSKGLLLVLLMETMVAVLWLRLIPRCESAARVVAMASGLARV